MGFIRRLVDAHLSKKNSPSIQILSQTRIFHNPISCFWMIYCNKMLLSSISSPMISLLMVFWVTFCMLFSSPPRELHISASMRSLSHWTARQAEPNRKAPNWTDPNWFGLDNTTTFLKAIHPRYVTNQYLFMWQRSHTHHYNIINQTTSFELFQVNIRPYQFKSYQ
jgi:hypothetical protein